MEKVFLNVECECTPEGVVTPTRMLWKNGKWYDIDRVLDVRMAPSLLTGGRGICYTCRVNDRVLHLFRDRDRWYAEP
jgi:hypothetical protein